MLKIFSKKKFVIVTIASVIMISGFVTVFVSLNDQRNIEETREINFLEIPENVPLEIFYSEQIFDICEYDMHCVVELMTDVSKNEKKENTMASFVELISLYHEKQVNSRCHNVSHHLGMWLYGYTQNLGESIQYADPLSCGGGIYHGIFENYFSIQQFESAEPDKVQIKHLCSSLDSGYYSLEMAHCLHGVGHGLLILYDYDVFNAVQHCEDFDSNQEQNSCANGVFMQNVLKNFETGEGTFDDDDILFPCNEMISRFLPTCYIWQGAYILNQREFEVYSSFDECDKIDQEFIKYCYYGIGGELETDAKGKMELAVLFCEAGKISSYHEFCFRGMAMKTSMVYLSNGFSFCPLVPEEFMEECYDGLGYWINLRHQNDEEKEQDCSRAENTKYLEACMNPKSDGINFL